MVVKIRGRVCYLVKRMFVSGAFKKDLPGASPFCKR
jgi:hypothetical protein